MSPSGAGSGATVLERVRAALARAGTWRADASAPPTAAPPTLTPTATIETFTRELSAVGGVVHRTTRAQAAEKVAQLAQRLAARSFACWQTELLGALGIDATLRASGMTAIVPSDAQRVRQELAELDMGISEADRGIAETGSLLLLPGKGRSRMVTAMARYHVALLPVDRLEASLDVVPALVAGCRTPEGQLRSNCVIITGPSRTADIENVLVVGIHGAVELHVFLLDN
jgi:L-lactate dehydrogenase complex protein LldG